MHPLIVEGVCDYCGVVRIILTRTRASVVIYICKGCGNHNWQPIVSLYHWQPCCLTRTKCIHTKSNMPSYRKYPVPEYEESDTSKARRDAHRQTLGRLYTPDEISDW
jgi:hypothetical protein